VPAVNSGNPLAAASQICDIPRRTLRDWVHQKRFPLKMLEQNAVLPADAEKQLHQRIIHLKQIGSGLKLSHIHRFDVKICKEDSLQSPCKGRMVGKGCLVFVKGPWLNSEERSKPQPWPTDDI
jgi:hypothetical protein